MLNQKPENMKDSFKNTVNNESSEASHWPSDSQY